MVVARDPERSALHGALGSELTAPVRPAGARVLYYAMHRRWLCLPLLLAACGDGSVGPSASRHTLTAVGDTVVYATPGSALAEPLAVLVSADGRPLPHISVQWTVVAGPLTLGSSVTSSAANGLAAVTAFAGSPGTARVRASTSRLQRPDAEFTIHVIDAPTLSGIADVWTEIIYAGICSTAIAFTLQAVAQQYVPPSNAAIILSAEGLFAAIGGALLLHERLEPIGYAGAALIFAAILIVELVPALRERRAVA